MERVRTVGRDGVYGRVGVWVCECVDVMGVRGGPRRRKKKGVYRRTEGGSGGRSDDGLGQGK